MKIFHLSHIDLDGYGCQYITQNFFKDIVFFNANYGKEVGVRLKSIIQAIQQEETQNLRDSYPRQKNEYESNKILILITDLNLSLQECKFLQKSLEYLKIQGSGTKNIEILLLDHHITGQENALLYDWYHIDTSRCASKITYEYLKSRFELLDPSKEKFLDSLVNVINAVDIWKEEDSGFELGKVLMRMITSSTEINRFMFDAQNRDHKFKMLDFVKNYIHLSNSAVEYDNNVFRLKKIALNGDPNKQTMDDIISLAQVQLLESIKEECSVIYEDKLGIVSYSIGGVSVLGNLFLKRNPEFSFYIDVGPRGNVSLRANGDCDVSLLSKKCFGGGGHKNAAGGRCENFKESFLYEDIRLQILHSLEREEQ